MRLQFATLALTLGLSTLAQADGIYKWVDDEGVVHFGSQPPQKTEIEVVKAPKSDRMKQWQQEQAALKSSQAAASAEAAPEVAAKPAKAPESKPADASKAEMAALAQRCEKAQRRLQELQSHARVREVDASGNFRVLPEEERQQRIQQTRDLLANC